MMEVIERGIQADIPQQTFVKGRSGRLRLIEGRLVPVANVSSKRIGAVLVFRDVTERHRMEETLQNAAKMESVGILAGGIAHDFNNILTAILSNLTLLQLDIGERPEKALVDEAVTATKRAAELTLQLLTFAKGGDPVRTAVHLQEVLREATMFAQRGSAVRSEFDLPADLWAADVDKGQISQVIQNLVINATQAMPAGGALRVTAANERFAAGSHPVLSAGDYVRISVADTGEGISPEHLGKIFDPYFTTKLRGHGLGLATAFSILRRHQGHIEASSVIGKGSTFTFWLPAAKITHAKPSAPKPFAGGPSKGKVLFMDDEEPILKMAERLMRRMGFEVESVMDGKSAVDLYKSAKEAGRPFNVVVMDLTIPGGMGGREAILCYKYDPNVRAIVSSGYPRSSDVGLQKTWVSGNGGQTLRHLGAGIGHKGRDGRGGLRRADSCGTSNSARIRSLTLDPMDPDSRKIPSNWPKVGLLFLLFLVLLASRRSEQWVSPQVWGEDGLIFSGFADHGWRSFVEPVNGYLVTVPKIVSAVAMAVSVYYYPLVGTLVAWVFIAAVGVAVATSPTRLKGGAFCAISIFLIPSNPETFGVPLYTFWWATVLLLVVALWDGSQGRLALRIPFVLAGGLSSPFILIVIPVLFFRAIWHRRFPAEWAVALAATATGAIQYHFMSTGAAAALPSLTSIALHVIPKFCGWFVCGNLFTSAFPLWGSGILVLALISGFLYLNRRDPAAWILCYLWCGAIASSISRIDPSILHPSLAGPRYFFLPFILLSWILIQLVLSANSPGWRITAGMCAIAGVLNALPVWTRRHDDLNWAENVRSARLFPQYNVPIESDGNRSRAWSISEPGKTWEALLKHDELFALGHKEALPTYAYRVLTEASDVGRGVSKKVQTASPNRVTATSLGKMENEGKELLISLTAGSRVQYRSGQAEGSPSMEVVGHENEFIAALPVSGNWVVLEFSNSKLPSEFRLRVRDVGHGLGEWTHVRGPD